MPRKVIAPSYAGINKNNEQHRGNNLPNRGGVDITISLC